MVNYQWNNKDFKFTAKLDFRLMMLMSKKDTKKIKGPPCTANWKVLND